jgi:hypothetical protein
MDGKRSILIVTFIGRIPEESNRRLQGKAGAGEAGTVPSITRPGISKIGILGALAINYTFTSVRCP